MKWFVTLAFLLFVIGFSIFIFILMVNSRHTSTFFCLKILSATLPYAFPCSSTARATEYGH